MEKVTFNSIVGFVLAVAFAIVMAMCMNAVLAGDYMQPNSVMNDTTRNINMVDPRIAYQYKDAVNQSATNPFYNILPVDKFPGALRYQKEVSISSLMRRWRPIMSARRASTPKRNESVMKIPAMGIRLAKGVVL